MQDMCTELYSYTESHGKVDKGNSIELQNMQQVNGESWMDLLVLI
jgi:hypothetical protein